MNHLNKFRKARPRFFQAPGQDGVVRVWAPCPRCKRTLPVGFFSRDRHRPDGLSLECKPCRRARSRDWERRRFEAGEPPRPHGTRYPARLLLTDAFAMARKLLAEDDAKDAAVQRIVQALMPAPEKLAAPPISGADLMACLRRELEQRERAGASAPKPVMSPAPPPPVSREAQPPRPNRLLRSSGPTGGGMSPSPPPSR